MSDSGSEGEVEVIEVKAANSLVPNLTISVEKDDDEPMVEFHDEENIGTTNADDENNKDVEVKLALKSFSHTKIYENKLLNEIGFTAEESRMRKKSRAKRFQSPLVRDEEQPSDDDQLPTEDLLQKVKGYNVENGIFKEIRLDAVHLRGLDDMSTGEIFKFFADHYPSHIEWIDDTSCNVVWKDETSAARAILSMSKPSQTKSTDEKSKDSNQETIREEKKDAVDDDLDLMDSGDEDEMDIEKDAKSQNESEPNKPFDNELRDCKKPMTKRGKDTFLKMRFATVNDKKNVGGANKSQYYRKYGNPNYGNVKGILSRSFKKRYHGKIAKREFEEYQPPEEIKPVAKVPTKRLYSEQAWTESKRARKNSESSSEDETSKSEREDQELINSSAKDLEGAIPVPEEKPEKKSYHSMEADSEMRKEKDENHSQVASSVSGTLTVKVKGKGSVWDRLGNKAASDKRKLEQDSTLPKSLRERLGTKRS